MHRFGSDLNSRVHFHVLVTDGVFSDGGETGAEFHPAAELDTSDIAAARCWTLLLARIYECLPLLCPRCVEPMRIIPSPSISLVYILCVSQEGP